MSKEKDIAHVVPELLEMVEACVSDRFKHEAQPWCWCQPVTEDVPPNGRVYIHRRFTEGRQHD